MKSLKILIFIFSNQKSGSSYGGSSYYGSDYGGDQFMDDIDDATQELFYGEWKNDKRNGS